MTRRLRLPALVLAAVCSPSLVCAQASPLFSWEDSMDGWQVNETNGQKMAKGARHAEIGATAGKKSLAIDMVDAYRPALRHDGADLASQIKGHKLAIDVTAPQGSAEGYLQIALAVVADGMDWKATDVQDVPQDGKPHTLTFDLSSWSIPASPGWFNLMVVTNTTEKTQPKTIYIDNLRIADAAPAVPAPTAAPAAVPAPKAAPAAPVGTLLSSWEAGLDGWQINIDPGTNTKLARGASIADVGVTEGKKSLAIDMVDAYRAALRRDDPGLAGQLKGKKLSLDVTAPEGTTADLLQVTVAIVADGMEWKAGELEEVAQDGKPHTLTFDISAWPMPANPNWFNLFIVTNTTEKSQPKTLYIDNLRIVP